MKPKEIELYLDIAERVSQLSYCNRAKVGAVLVKGNNILSYGYNGTPPGELNICEENDRTKPSVIHAEKNALIKCDEFGLDPNGSSIFVTIPPCQLCAEELYNAGVIAVYHRDEHISASNGTPDELWYSLLGIRIYKIERKHNEQRFHHPEQSGRSEKDCGCGC
jgi:dCMP deaminase